MIPSRKSVKESEYATSQTLPEAPSSAIIRPPSTSEVVLSSGDDDSAYARAWSSLDDKQRKQLAHGRGIQDLFNSFREENAKLSKDSAFYRGLRVVQPCLENLRTTIGFVGPVVSIEPTAGAGLGVAKGVLTIVIAICGAANELTESIEAFLVHIAALERCSEIVKDGKQLPKVHEAMVQVYQDLLHFFLTVASIYESHCRTLRLALKTAWGEIPNAAARFQAHACHLSKLLEVETFVSVFDIKKRTIGRLE